MIEARWSSVNGDKARINAKKSDAVCVMELERIVHYELPLGQTIDFNFYCQQLRKIMPSKKRENAPRIDQ